MEIFCSVIIYYKNKYKNWFFVRHKNLSIEPMTDFKKLFKDLNIDFTKSVENRIEKYIKSRNPSEPTKGQSLPIIGVEIQYQRNSKANIHNWKSRLTKSEIEKVRSKVEDLSSQFYLNDDW